MNRTDYQRILFETAMLVMACDGEIHPSELQEMELAFEKNLLFKNLNFDEELGRTTAAFDQDKKEVIMKYFEKIATAEFDPAQKLQILEIILRIMYADNRIEPNEIRFLKLVKSRLGVMDEIFIKRFGEVDFLPSSHTPEKITDTARAFVKEVELPDFGDLIELREKGES